MGILDTHADELLQAGTNTPYVEPPKPTPKFSMWGATTALPKGLASGASESTGFFADITGAFGQVMAATDPLIGITAPHDVREKLMQGQKEAETRLRETGVDFSSEAGDLFRDVGRSYRPDPQTASAAEQVVFGFSKFASKAVGYSMAGGPVVGAILTGADEGMTAADDLRQQGVDLGARTAAGAIAGVTAAAGVALPVAGKTLAQTAGLVALGGPISFAGQQAATRYILDNAGYDKIAEQYDPLDPVGLAVSTLVPAGFGAYGLRGARLRATEAKRLAGETKTVESDAPEVAPEPRVAEVEAQHVDAARVALVRETVDSWNLGRPEDAQAAAAHLEAFARAQDQIATGQRVEVSDVAPKPAVIPAAQRDANFKAWFGDSKVVDEGGTPRVMYHGTRSDVPAFDAAALETATGAPSARLGFFFTDTVSGEPAGWMAHGAEVWAADKEGSYAGGGNVMPVYLSLKNPKELTFGQIAGAHLDAAAADKLRARLESEGYDGIKYREGDETWYIAFRREQAKSAIGNSGRFDPESGSLTDPLAQFAARIEKAVREVASRLETARQDRAPAPEKMDAPIGGEHTELAQVARAAVDELAARIEQATGVPMTEITSQIGRALDGVNPLSKEAGDYNLERGSQETTTATAARTDAGNAGAAGSVPPGDRAGNGQGAERGGTQVGKEVAAQSARLAEVSAQFPDLQVMLDGMDAPMPLRELLDRIKAEADEDMADGALYEVAAQCALLNGPG